jgi:hypothetical protein
MELHQLKRLFIFVCYENKKACSEIKMIVTEVWMVSCFKGATLPVLPRSVLGKPR